jgi:hypothetical protein
LYDFELITEFNEIMPLPKGFSAAKASLLFTVAELQGGYVYGPVRHAGAALYYIGYSRCGTTMKFDVLKL